jgi:aminoglycoside phosphotransferase family enzyme/predicted kinase
VVTWPDDPFVDHHTTHSGAVFLLGDRAYKLKRPVRLPFLDFSTRQAREEACVRELVLNRRLTPDVYLGLGALRGPDGEEEPLVVMRRLPEHTRLAALVRRGDDLRPHLTALARQLAVFHGGAARDARIAAAGTRDALRRRWTDNLREVADDLGSLDGAVVAEIERLALRFLDGRDALLETRVHDGRVVDGHGDLLAEDIFCLDDGPRVLDCLDFDARLRHLDQLDDVCCLVMDLNRLGAADAADHLLAAYLELTGDHAPPSLVDHYVAYRAFVRAKVGRVPAAAGGRPDAERHARLALDRLRTGAVRLVLVGGAPGTGKTTVAGGVADRLGYVVLSSDRVRKELAGLDPARPAPSAVGEGIYTAEWTFRTYDELLRRADLLLAHGESVVLDATWHDEQERAQARSLADRALADVVELACVVDPVEAERRIGTRATGTSDADAAVARRVRSTTDPWPGAVPVDTSRPVAECAAAACEAVGVPERRVRPRPRMLPD